MKYTLLELTQRVLASIKGEQVNSIADTEESLSVVGIIKECYITLAAEKDYPEQKTLFQLVPSGDNTKPTVMSIPESVYSMEWLRYNVIEDGDTDPVWRDLTYMDLKPFIEHTQALNLDETTVDSMSVTVDGTAVTYKYWNDRAPRYFTSVDDETLLFDAYDSAVDTTLQAVKTLAYGTKISWTEDDDFIPDLDPQQFVILLKEAKMLAWQELKSVDNVLAAKQSRDLKIAAEDKKNRANYKNTGYYDAWYPNYGRK